MPSEQNAIHSSTTQSPPRITRVGIVAKPGLTETAVELTAVTAWLDARGVESVVEDETSMMADLRSRPRASRDDLPLRVDLMLVFGGDGTLLGMADRIAQADREIPIRGVNFGTLGFLTEISASELLPSLEAALDGTATIESRMMLRSRVERAGLVHVDRIVLNDVAVTGGSLSRIVEFEVFVSGDFVARFNADGLIISSPTGSTAYNLSAGGPIVHPAVDAMVLNPIAPHALTNRPIVIPASAEVAVQPVLQRPGDEAFVTFDGQAGLQLETGDVVHIRRARRPMRLVRGSARSYYEVLRTKLRWTER
ncbi:MAG: NAD(+)/NADH kinase [Acidobacteria bacterium]|nr:NAD(+)/NADH kinase [Acidobacteriota bacterium]